MALNAVEKLVPLLHVSDQALYGVSPRLIADKRTDAMNFQVAFFCHEEHLFT